jgi:hypothetical protein
VHPTPIERAIAGEPSDRRRRYERRLAGKGIKRVAVSVRAEHADMFHKLASLSRVAEPGAWESIMAEPIEFFREVIAEAAERKR